MKDAFLLAQYCKTRLDLSTEISRDYGYAHLPLCVIDAVFSIGVRYASVEKTIFRFCEFAGVHANDLLSISDFILIHESNGSDGMARAVYQNRQRTSTRNGILKAEAVYRFAKVLAQFGAETLPDVPRVKGFPDFEAEIKTIPGQRSGISLQYFYMLTGDENTIKPDRMVARFIEQATHQEYNWRLYRRYNRQQMTHLVNEACWILQSDYPHLIPRSTT